PASMVPGLLTIESPTRAANPDRGCTSPTIPTGMATATPVPTSARCPGASSTSSALYRSTPASPWWARAGSGSPGSRRTTARLVDTGAQITLGRVSETPVTPHSVRYRERLWVPWWWWPLGFGLAALIAVEVNMGVPSLPNWLPFAILFVVVAGAPRGSDHIRRRRRRAVGRRGASADQCHRPLRGDSSLGQVCCARTAIR